jgi:hypothetical protein
MVISALSTIELSEYNLLYTMLAKIYICIFEEMSKIVNLIIESNASKFNKIVEKENNSQLK